MILYQAIHLAKELENRKVEMDNLRMKKGESDHEVIQLSMEVVQLSKEYQSILSVIPSKRNHFNQLI